MKADVVMRLLLVWALLFPIQGELLTTVWVARHGAREPKSTWNGILRPEATRFQGYRRLTNVGMRQQHILGRIFQEKYGHLNLSPASVVVRSTAFQRTFDSGLSFLTGFQQTAKAITSTLLVIWDTHFNRPSVPIMLSPTIIDSYHSMYPHLGEVGKYTIYHDFSETDPLSFSHKTTVCPGLPLISRNFKSSELCKHYEKKGLALIAPILKRVYGSSFPAHIGQKLQMVRYAYYYRLPTKVGITDQEAATLKEGRHMLDLRKGYFLPKIVKMACHHLFNQIFNLFDFAIAHDRLGEHFTPISLYYHKVMAARDIAYVPRYKWLMLNPGLAPQLRAVVYQNHDNLLFTIMRALSTMLPDEIRTPFASVLALELHKEDHGPSTKPHYYVKAQYNDVAFSMPLCDPNHCPFKTFVRTLRRRGTFLNDHRFYNLCHTSGDEPVHLP